MFNCEQIAKTTFVYQISGEDICSLIYF